MLKYLLWTYTLTAFIFEHLANEIKEVRVLLQDLVYVAFYDFSLYLFREMHLNLNQLLINDTHIALIVAATVRRGVVVIGLTVRPDVVLEAGDGEDAPPDHDLLFAGVGAEGALFAALHREAHYYFEEEHAEGPYIVTPRLCTSTYPKSLVFVGGRQVVEEVLNYLGRQALGVLEFETEIV